jgi:hypothetical protein
MAGRRRGAWVRHDGRLDGQRSAAGDDRAGASDVNRGLRPIRGRQPRDGSGREGPARRLLPVDHSARDDRSEGVADTAGHFRCAELPPGRYTLEAGPKWNDVSIVASKVLDVAAGSTDVQIVVARAKK